MTEVLTRFPDVTDTEAQFEQFDQIKAEELLFPKLDGILLPIVMDNADVVAPCPWMEDAEVSLSVALNNYYRPMTEENADEVIAEVYDFLAGQSVPDTVIEQESEYATRSILTMAPQVESVTFDEHADMIEETRGHIPEIHARPAEDAATSTKASFGIHEAPPDKAIPEQAQPVSQERHIVFESQVSDTPETPQLLEDDEEKECVLKIPQPTPTDNSKTVSTPPTSIEPHVLEVDREYVINHDSPSKPTIQAKGRVDADISDAPVSPRPTNPETERIDIMRNELSKETPLLDVEDGVESLSAEDEDAPAHEEPIKYELTNADEYFDKPDGLNIENSPSEATRETASTAHGADEAITEIDLLLSDARQPAEIDRTNEAEAAKGLAEIIANMAAGLELDDGDTEIVMNEETVQEELMTLYAELLDGSPFNHRDKFIHLLVALTIESHDSRKSDMQPPAAAIRKKIKSLKVVINSLRQAGSRIIAIGRLALRSQAVAGAVRLPVGLYARGVRD